MGEAQTLYLIAKGVVKMKKKAVVLSIVALSFLVFNSSGQAWFFGGKKPESLKMTGTVAAVDLRKSLIAVTAKEGYTRTFLTGKDTKFVKKGGTINLAELKNGDRVKVEYWIKKQEHRARLVSVEESPKSAAPKNNK